MSAVRVTGWRWPTARQRRQRVGLVIFYLPCQSNPRRNPSRLILSHRARPRHACDALPQLSGPVLSYRSSTRHACLAVSLPASPNPVAASLPYHAISGPAMPQRAESYPVRPRLACFVLPGRTLPDHAMSNPVTPSPASPRLPCLVIASHTAPRLTAPLCLCFYRLIYRL